MKGTCMNSGHLGIQILIDSFSSALYRLVNVTDHD